MPEAPTYHPRVIHSLTFYHSVLLALIEGLNRRFTDKQIAELLNSRGLLAPSGKPWSLTSVKLALYKMRNHKTHPSTLHRALLQLCFNGDLLPTQTTILFTPRYPTESIL